MTTFLLYVLFISYVGCTIAMWMISPWLAGAWSIITGIGFYIWAGQYFDTRKRVK